jgi:hypothetical protein
MPSDLVCHPVVYGSQASADWVTPIRATRGTPAQPADRQHEWEHRWPPQSQQFGRTFEKPRHQPYGLLADSFNVFMSFVPSHDQLLTCGFRVTDNTDRPPDAHDLLRSPDGQRCRRIVDGLSRAFETVCRAQVRGDPRHGRRSRVKWVRTISITRVGGASGQ